MPEFEVVGVAIILAGAAIWCVVLAVHRWMLLRRAMRWRTTRGEILVSMEYRDPTKDGTQFLVQYRYDVGGRVFEATTPRASGIWFFTRKQQTDFVQRFRVGLRVDVYYDPQQPERSCLDRADASGILALGSIAGMAAAGAMLALAFEWSSIVQWLSDLRWPVR